MARSAITSTATPPWPKTMIGAEGRVLGNAGDQLVVVAAVDHLLHGEPADPSLRRKPFHLQKHLPGRLLDRFGRAQIETHAADVGLVRDVGRQDLQHHRSGDIACKPRGLRRVGCAEGLDDGYSVERQERLGLRLGEERAALRQTPCR